MNKFGLTLAICLGCTAHRPSGVASQAQVDSALDLADGPEVEVAAADYSDGVGELSQGADVSPGDGGQSQGNSFVDECGEYVCPLPGGGPLVLCPAAATLPVGATMTVTMVSRCQDAFWFKFRMLGTSGFSFQPYKVWYGPPAISLDDSANWNGIAPEQPVWMRYPWTFLVKNEFAQVGASAALQVKYYYGAPPWAHINVSADATITSVP